MPPRKNPLEDARKRLQEKLNSIKDQTDYITQVLSSTVSKATNPANELLKFKERKKFFQKYSQVSQDLEKCLDFLLVLSDSIDAQGDDEGTDEEDSNDNEEDLTDKADAVVIEVKEYEKEKPEFKEVSSKSSSSAYDTKGRLKLHLESSDTKSTPQSFSETNVQRNKQETHLTKIEKPLNSYTQSEPKQDSESSNSINDSTQQQGTDKNAYLANQTTVKGNSNIPPQLKMPLVYSRNTKKDVHCKRKGSAERRSPAVGLEPTERSRKSPLLGLESNGKNSPSVGLEPTGRKPSLTQGKDKKTETTTITTTNINCLSILQLYPYRFKNGECLEVVVTEVLSPWELWIQPTGNGFNLLMEKMCMKFAKAAASGYKGGLSVPPAVGDFCCARFLDDDTWYRVRVIGVYQSDDITKQHNLAPQQRLSSTDSTSSADSSIAGMEIEVLCVDDGSREKLPLSRLRPLDESLAGIPCQAICCALTGVQPLVRNTVKSQGDSLWGKESIEWLRNKVSGVKLLAYPKRTEDESLVMVDMFFDSGKKKIPIPGRDGAFSGKDATLPGHKSSIAHIMVSEGFAQNVAPVQKPSNSKLLGSPPSPVSKDRHLSSSSSLSMSSLQDSLMPVFEENILHSKFMNDSAMLVFDENVTKLSQEDLNIDKGGPLNKVITRQVESTKKQRHPISAKSEDYDHSENKIAQSEISVHQDPNTMQSKQLSSEEDVTLSDVSQPARESTRYPLEGSRLTDSIHDDQDDLSKIQFSKNDQNEAFMSTQDQPLLLQVMLSEVVSPSEFYVHLVTPEAVLLTELTEDLQIHYKETGAASTPADYCLGIGDYCCAKFSQDDMWCRAKVLDVKVTPSGEGQDPFDQELLANIYVFYLDYGNSEWISMDNTRPLLPKFMLLPGFAVKCQLSGVKSAVNSVDIDGLASNELPKSNNAETEPLDINQPHNSTSPETDKQTAAASSEPSKLDTKNTVPVAPSTPPKEFPTGRGRKKKKKGKKLPLNKDVILRAAGDESGDSELSDGGLIFDFSSKNEEKSQVKTDDKTEEKLALPERYLLPSPTRTPLSDNTEAAEKTVDSKPNPEWTEEAIELFKGLTDDDKPLRGVMVPWNARMYEQIYYPTAGRTRADITYQRPLLVLRLYDTTGEDDVDIVQVLVETGLAELCEDEQSLSLEDYREQDFTTKTLHLTVSDLETTAAILEQEGASPLSSSSDDAEDEAMTLWNPMMDDFKSSRNAYKIDTNDLDIAIHGFKPIETQYCRFFRNPKTRCWRGDNCPMLHVKEGEDTTIKVQAFCNNNDFTVDLPQLDSWVGVRVTAVLDPGHFWVQLPCGSGPIDKRIIEERLGLTNDENSDDEDFESMMERMNKFYKRNLFRDSTTILPAVGELVAAKYSENEQWYRACVVDVLDCKFKVSFVDFGNSEWTAESNVKRMLPQFLHLPFQAIECFLGNVESVEEDGEWSAESMTTFESLTQDKLLIAHVSSISTASCIMCVELYDTQGEQEININQELVKQGFALETTVKITIPSMRTGPGSTGSAGSSPDSSDCEVVMYPG